MKVCFRKATTYVAISACLTTYIGCGSSDNGDTTESTGSTSSTAAIEESLTEALGGDSNAATSIKALPNLSSFLGGSTTSLTTSTAPNFIDIDTPEEVEQYLSGDISTLLARVGEKVTSGDYTGEDGVEFLIKKFQRAALKCEMMESTLHNLSELRTQTTSACYISEISESEGSLLTYQSGTQYSSDAEVLVPTTDGTEKIVKLLMPEDNEEEAIVISIKAADKVLTYQLDFCAADGTGLGRDLVQFDHRVENKPVLKMTTMHQGDEELDDNEGTINYAFQASLEAPIQKNSTAKYEFIEGAERKFSAIGYEKFTGTGASSLEKFRSNISVTDNVMILRERSSGYEKWTENSNIIKVDHAERGMYGVEFSGTSFEDTKFTAGAGRRFWVLKATNGAEVDTDQGADRTAFEFNADATPQYETKVGVAKDILKKLAEVNHKTDSTLKEKPKKPSFDFATDSGCAATPTAVYLMDTSSAEFATIQSECENEIGDDASLCETIAQAQDDILNHIESMEQSCATCNIDSEDETEELETTDLDDTEEE